MINKKRLLRAFNTKMLNKYNYAFFETIEYSKIINLINNIKAHELGYNLIRIDQMEMVGIWYQILLKI